MKKCATCWDDPITRGWYDPDNRNPRGTSESNWICEDCRKKPHNRGWQWASDNEVFGREVEDQDDSHPVADSEPGPYETELCLQIMKRYCLGESYRKIAAAEFTPLSYVQATIKYWLSNYGYFVEQLKFMLERKC